MPKQQPVRPIPLANEIPDVCEVCGQSVDKRSAASIVWHSNPARHLPYSGGKRRPGWL